MMKATIAKKAMVRIWDYTKVGPRKQVHFQEADIVLVTALTMTKPEVLCEDDTEEINQMRMKAYLSSKLIEAILDVH